MTDAQVERTDKFVAVFRALIADMVTDPASPFADEHRSGLRRIADTLHQVPFELMANLANLDAALHGWLLELIEARLHAVGAGPKQDYADAVAFLDPLAAIVEQVRMRRLQ